MHKGFSILAGFVCVSLKQSELTNCLICFSKGLIDLALEICDNIQLFDSIFTSMVNLTTSMSPRYILSQLFFSWLNPVFHKGFAKNVLETDDLHDLNEENKAEYQTKTLYDFWYEETRKGEQNAPRYKPSIGRAVWRCYRKSLLHSAFYTTIESAARVAQALLIGLLVTGLAEGSDGIHRARLQYYVAALCFVSYTYVITLHRGQFLGKLFGMRLRVSLTGLIYKKVS